MLLFSWRSSQVVTPLFFLLITMLFLRGRSFIPLRNFKVASKQLRSNFRFGGDSLRSISPQFSTLNDQQFSTSKETNDVNQASVSLKDKIKQIWKSYGYVAAGTYFGIYVLTLSSMYLALDFDIFNAATFGLDGPSAVNKVLPDITLDNVFTYSVIFIHLGLLFI
jgi:hypothetical protein